MGLFSKDGSGFKNVTVYLGASDEIESIHVMGRLTNDEIIRLVDKIPERPLAQRIREYLKKHEAAQKTLPDMPKFISHAQFGAYVREKLAPNAEWALVGNSIFTFLIVAEKK